MAECEVCRRKTQLYLCEGCSSELREMLTNLAERTATNLKTGETRPTAGWLELLEDAALSRTRLGESARRSSDRNTPLPVNLKASELLNNIHGMLARWSEAVSLHTETLAIEGQETA
jgi:hypothetical protein